MTYALHGKFAVCSLRAINECICHLICFVILTRMCDFHVFWVWIQKRQRQQHVSGCFNNQFLFLRQGVREKEDKSRGVGKKHDVLCYSRELTSWL